MRLLLRDATGRSLQEELLIIPVEGRLHHSLNVASLPAGLYFVELRQGMWAGLKPFTVAP